MRFVSKNSNLMVVLKPGLPGNHLTGQQPVTGVYVKFQNGLVEVKDENMVEQLKLHPGFNIDFIAVDENELDPYAYNRTEIEPVHNIKELKFGQVVGGKKSQVPVKLSPEMQKFIEEQATNMAKAMLPGMMKEFLTQMKENKGVDGPTEGKLAEPESVVEEEISETNVKIDKNIKGKNKKDKAEEAPTA